MSHGSRSNFSFGRPEKLDELWGFVRSVRVCGHDNMICLFVLPMAELLSRYEFERSECLDRRFQPSKASGTLGALPRPSTSGTRCLDGLGFGMEQSRAVSALTPEQNFSKLLPQIRAAGGISIELWLRATERKLPQASAGSMYKEQLILAIGSSTDAEWSRTLSSVTPCNKETAALLIAQASGLLARSPVSLLAVAGVLPLLPFCAPHKGAPAAPLLLLRRIFPSSPPFLPPHP